MLTVTSIKAVKCILPLLFDSLSYILTCVSNYTFVIVSSNIVHIRAYFCPVVDVTYLLSSVISSPQSGNYLWPCGSKLSCVKRAVEKHDVLLYDRIYIYSRTPLMRINRDG